MGSSTPAAAEGQHQRMQHPMYYRVPSPLREVHSTIANSDTLRSLTAGAVAGMLERILSYPIETSKVKLQNTNISLSAFSLLYSQTLREGGVLSFYRGFLPSVFARSFQHSLRFGITQANSRVLPHSSNRATNQLLGGMIAGVVDSLVMSPFETVKTRTQATGRRFRTVAVELYHEDGVHAYYRGITATILRQTANLGLRFSLFAYFEQSLSRLQRHSSTTNTTTLSSSPPRWHSFVAGALAGAVSAYFTNPFDLVKTRVQATTTTPSRSSFSPVAESKRGNQVMSIREAVKMIDGQKGGHRWQKWFRGAWTRVLQQTPSVAVSFFLYRSIEAFFMPAKT
ncbi:Mitochondrial succinate-fumarate transporter [Balamuthia mandrillaris]